MTTTAGLQTDAPVVSSSTSATRKRANKPLMEKRRRARINQSLANLRNLILDYLKKESTRTSKLEKADILETTLKYLQELQRHQTAVKIVTDPGVSNKFQAGYNECIKEVQRYLRLNTEDTDSALCQNVIAHVTRIGRSSRLASSLETFEGDLQTPSYPIGQFRMLSPSPDEIESNLGKASTFKPTSSGNGYVEPFPTKFCSVQVLPTGDASVFILQDIQAPSGDFGTAISPVNGSDYCQQLPLQTQFADTSNGHNVHRDMKPTAPSDERPEFSHSRGNEQRQNGGHFGNEQEIGIMWRPW